MTHPLDEPLNFAFNSFSTESYDFAKPALSGSLLKPCSWTSLFRIVTKYRSFLTVSELRLCDAWTAVILSCKPTVLPLGAPKPFSNRCSKSFVALMTNSKSFLYWLYEVVVENVAPIMKMFWTMQVECMFQEEALQITACRLEDLHRLVCAYAANISRSLADHCSV